MGHNRVHCGEQGEASTPSPSFSQSDSLWLLDQFLPCQSNCYTVMGQDQVCTLWGPVQRENVAPGLNIKDFKMVMVVLSQEGVPLNTGPCAWSPAQGARNPSWYPGRSWHVVGSERMWPLTLHPALGALFPHTKSGLGLTCRLPAAARSPVFRGCGQGWVAEALEVGVQQAGPVGAHPDQVGVQDL